MESRPIALRALRFSLGLLLLAAGTACRREPAPPIVLISIDTLRADRLPAYGYRGTRTPAIDRLAADSVVFDAAYSHYPLTLPAHVSALTGLLPPHHGVRDNVGYPLDTVAHPPIQKRLADAGWPTGGFVSAFVLRRETGFATGFGTWDEPPAPERGAPMDVAQRAGTATLAPALAWLQSLESVGARKEEPFFLFFHVYEPHAPYTPPEPFASRHSDPYDGEVEAADDAVGKLLDRLRERGIYDRAVVVLMSDHGEGLGDHGERQHGVFLYPSTLRVALMVKLPGNARAGERVERPVGLVDLAPTLARLARLKESPGLDGRDLLEPRTDGAERGLYAETYYPRLHFGWSDLAAMIESRWYYVRGPEPELFDRGADPGLERNVLAENRSEYARLRKAVEAIDRPLADPQGVDEETAKRLAALGYLTAGARTTDLDLPDPKTQRHLLAAIEEGLDAFWAGRDADAARELEKVLAANPGMADIWAYLARARDRMGDKRGGLAAWEKVLELSGGMGTVALTVGEHYLELGNPAQAEKVAESVRDLAPAGALELLIQVDLAMGRTDQARARMEDAVAKDLASPLVRRRLALAALAAKDATRALALLEPVKDPEPATLVVRSLALADVGRQQEGLAALEKAKQESASGADFFETLGVALLELGRLEQARAAFEQVVRNAPRTASAWNALGVINARLGDPRAAVAAWRRAVEAKPGLAEAWLNLGLVAAHEGDRALARQALGNYLRHAPASLVAERARAEQALRDLGSR